MPPKRKRPRDDDDQDNSNQDNKRYAYLKPRVRHVSQQTIKDKWTPLSEPAQGKVHDMFLAAERPAIVRQHNERKRIEAQSAVQAVVKNLGKRLPRMLFPPGTNAADFEYESALGVLRSLVASKAAATDESHFLKALIKKEEALLQDERNALQDMEKNAKKLKAQKGRRTKSEEHRILRQLDDQAPSKDQQPTGFTISGGVGDQATLSALDDDPEVVGLLKQLNGHLQSMQNNTAPLAGLQDAIVLAQNALSLSRMEED